MDGITSVLQRRVFAVDVGRQEELRVPGKTLAGGEVCDLVRTNVSKLFEK
jgi:hypothetical protein